MKKFLWFLFLGIFLISCGTAKNTVYRKANTTKSTVKSPTLRNLDSDYKGSISKNIKKLLEDAENYLGTPYKYGGNTASGFDCSGYTVKVFGENNYTLPRRSQDQATVGTRVDISKVKPGDLLFFATSGGQAVSHVGIVHDIAKDGEIKFIHASTSKGVTISSLNEKYWNKAYLYAQSIF